MAQKFRKKPVVIEAMQFLGNDVPDGAHPVIQWVLAGGGTATWREAVTELRAPNGELARTADSEHLRIRTLEGVMRAEVGDWIIRGVQGEHYPCKPDIFAATYEPLEGYAASIDAAEKACSELGAALLEAIEKALHPVLGRIFGSKAITNINRNIEVLKNLINR